MPAHILGVNWARGLLFDWWAVGCPVKVVRLLLGQSTPVKKTKNPHPHAGTRMEGGQLRVQAHGVEKRWDREVGTRLWNV